MEEWIILKSLTEKKYRITWVEPDGTVKFDNKTDASKMENHANREEIKESLKFGRGGVQDIHLRLRKDNLLCKKDK